MTKKEEKAKIKKNNAAKKKNSQKKTEKSKEDLQNKEETNLNIEIENIRQKLEKIKFQEVSEPVISSSSRTFSPVLERVANAPKEPVNLEQGTGFAPSNPANNQENNFQYLAESKESSRNKYEANRVQDFSRPSFFPRNISSISEEGGIPFFRERNLSIRTEVDDLPHMQDSHHGEYTINVERVAGSEKRERKYEP